MVVRNPHIPCSSFTPKELVPSEAARAPSWSKLELKVFFKVKEKMTSRKSSKGISSLQTLPGTILKWANVWHEEAAKKGVTVPKFVPASKEDEGDICTELKGYTESVVSVVGISEHDGLCRYY